MKESVGEGRVWKESHSGKVSWLRACYRRHRFSQHAHDTFVIGTVLQGTASCFRRADLLARPGQMVVIPPGRPHGGECSGGGGGWSWLAVYPDAEFLRSLREEIAPQARGGPSFGRLLYPDDELVRAFVLAHRQFLEGDDLGGESGLVEALTLLMARHGERLGSSDPSDPLDRAARVKLRRSLELIEHRFTEPISLTELASASGLSRYHFLRVFKREVGITPHAFVTLRRVEHARALIREGEDLAAVAYESGFSDQSHMTHRFKQFVGVTPGEFAAG